MLSTMASGHALQVEYFTREASGFEIESKYNIGNMEPWLDLCQMVDDISGDLWAPFKVQTSMGTMPTRTRYLDLVVEFWGVEQQKAWRQIAMCIKHPWDHDSHMVVFKNKGSVLLENFSSHAHKPLVRREESKYQWMKKECAIALIKSHDVSAQSVGIIRRRKYSVYIYNKHSHRNYCLSCDICLSGERSLSQLEIEYKGRNGVWFVNEGLARVELVHEYEQLHLLLRSLSSRRRTKTFQGRSP